MTTPIPFCILCGWFFRKIILKTIVHIFNSTTPLRTIFVHCISIYDTSHAYSERRINGYNEIIINRRLPSTIQPDRFYWTFCHDRVERDDYSGNGRVHGKVTGRPSRFPRFIGFILSHVFAGVGGVLGSMAHDIGDPDRVPSMPSAWKTFAKTVGRNIFTDEYDPTQLGSRLCRRWVMSEHQVTSSHENESWKLVRYIIIYIRRPLPPPCRSLHGSKVFRDIANVYIREMYFRLIHCYGMEGVRIPTWVGCFSFF